MAKLRIECVGRRLRLDKICDAVYQTLGQKAPSILFLFQKREHLITKKLPQHFKEMKIKAITARRTIFLKKEKSLHL